MTVLITLWLDINPLKYVEKQGKYMGIYFIISRPARRREIIICTMCVRTYVRHAVFSETTTVTHFW